MIAWPIRAALASNCFERVIISTDDAEIANVARSYGAEAPFERPANLADDHTGTSPVIAHAIAEIEANGTAPIEAVCCIYATAPFLRADDLQRGLDVLLETGADYAFSVTSYAFPIQRAIHVTDGGRVGMFHPEHVHTRSQDLQEAWHDAGQFYWGRLSAWTSQVPILGRGSVAVRLPRYRVQDIDTAEDWERAEWMFRALSSQDAD